MTTQLTFDLAPLVDPIYQPEASIQERYEAWIALNPWVLDVLEVLVARWLAKGHRKVGIKQMWEVVRWQYGETTGDTFRANNNFHARAARDLIARHPEWAEAIETRSLRAA